ncbi:DUF3426 domain-containing protein [Pseudomonas sp. CrR25]|nr:DUF3426 domain-containing protein [Pseudomonas sp. CrR25]
MTESFVTQCPHCHTSFRVSRAQLGAAHGAVRCGACLHVFNAAQQLLEQGQQSAVPAPPTPASPASTPPPAPSAAQPPRPSPATFTPPGKNPSDTLWIHDDLDLDSLDLDEELAKLEEQEHQLSQQFLALDRSPKYAEAFQPLGGDEAEAHDEQWAEALLRDDQATTAPSIAPEPTDTPPSPPSNAPTRSEPTLTLSALDLDEPDSLAEPMHLSARDDQHAAEQTAQRAPLDTPDDEPTPLQPPRSTADKSPRSEPGLSEEQLFELDDEPLLLDWQPPRKPWGRWLGWGLLNLLGAAALSGQYLAYHFEELARQDHYRPWFEQLCPSLGCSLPSKVDISQIKSSNLVVRSHPEFSGALVVDAILYNRAPFTQPFPLLEMRFADINGQLLASRRFKPGEYLAGELAGQAEMPPQTPIHVSLDILDPGTQAVNYSLSFHSPE